MCPDGLGLFGVGWILVVGLPGEGGTATGSAEAVGHEGSQAPAPARDPGDIPELPTPKFLLFWGRLVLCELRHAIKVNLLSTQPKIFILRFFHFVKQFK